MTSGGSAAAGDRLVATRPGRSRWIRVVAGVLGAVSVVLCARLFLVDSVVVSGDSMRPGLHDGERLLVLRPLVRTPRRGDLVVLPSGALAGRPGGDLVVKRIVAVGGDHVVCCADDGRLVLNDTPLTEGYLYVDPDASTTPGGSASDSDPPLSSGQAASEVTFDVVVPRGRVWLMGDHRAISEDSRRHLGDPGSGTVRVGDIHGVAWVRYWPSDRLGRLVAHDASSAASSGAGGAPHLTGAFVHG